MGRTASTTIVSAQSLRTVGSKTSNRIGKYSQNFPRGLTTKIFYNIFNIVIEIMPILSRKFGVISAKCAACSRTYSARDAGDISSFFEHRRRFRRDLCSICMFAEAVGYFEYQCAGCNNYVQGTREELSECLNVRNLALCKSCSEGYYGVYNKKNKAMKIAIAVVRSKKFRKEPRRYPDYLDFRKEEAAYGPAVRNLTKKNYRRFKSILNPHNRLIAPSGTVGGHHIDHIVPISLCWRCKVSIQDAAAPENLQIVPWKINLLRGESCINRLIK